MIVKCYNDIYRKDALKLDVMRLGVGAWRDL